MLCKLPHITLKLSNLVPELPHLVTKPLHLAIKAIFFFFFFWGGGGGDFCGRFMRDALLSRMFCSAFEFLCLMRQTTLQPITIEDKCIISKLQLL